MQNYNNQLTPSCCPPAMLIQMSVISATDPLPDIRLGQGGPARRRDSSCGSPGLRTVALISAAILLTFVPATLAAAWYVDKDAKGANNGTSWIDAWRSPTNISWGNVAAGDTVYFSGGSTQKTYKDRWVVGKSGAPGSPITFRPGQDSGHSGQVVFDFDASGDNAAGHAVDVRGRSHLVFNGNVNGARHLVWRNLRNVLQRTEACAFMGHGNGPTDPLKDLVFEYLAIDNCNNGFRLYGSVSNCVVRYCFLTNIRGNGGIALLGGYESFDMNLVHDNYVETAFNQAVPPGATGVYVGPDAVQADHGTTISNNVFKVVPVDYYTSTQHPDTLQVPGNFLKVCGNEFINIGDSAISPASWLPNERRTNIWIYNNVFRIEQVLDTLPEYFRFYNNSHPILSVDSLKIVNNTFIDNTGYQVIRFSNWGPGGAPTGSGNEIRNNIFYNCGGSQSKSIIYMADSSGFDANSWTFSHNIYFHDNPASAFISFRGTNYPVAGWVNTAGIETSGSTNRPVFISYAPGSPDNDLRLASADTAARNTGVSLDGLFVTDKAGVSRSHHAPWDRGAYEEQTASSRKPAAPGVSTAQIMQTPGDENSARAGCQALASRQYFYSAAIPTSPTSWQWIQQKNDDPSVVVRSGSGAVEILTYNYPSDSGGDRYTWSIVLDYEDGARVSGSLVVSVE